VTLCPRRDELAGRSEDDESQFTLPVRLNYLFTPDLSLEVYAQPFAASGRYFRFGELPEPGSRELREYDRVEAREDTGTGELFREVTDAGSTFTLPFDDFNLRSLRSNAVLRWEWRPGSTLYVAWQQTRRGVGDDGEFDFGRDPARLFRTAPDNILVVKGTYWLSL